MPKDARKNVDRYKLAGGHLNEFEFHQNQGQVNESAKKGATKKAGTNKGAGKKAGSKKAAAKKSRKK